MINSIRLVNWRSHSDTSLQFRSGTNLLVGIMGAGKSSILEGISFALFGTFPALERRKLKIEHLVRLNEPFARVVLEFSWGGSSYRVEREAERNKRGASTRAEIFKDNALVENGTSAVNTYIENLTSVDYDLFTRAIYSEQNNIEYFLNLDPSRRKKEIDVLLGLDKFETARSNMVTVTGRIRTRRRTLEEKFKPETIPEIETKEKDQVTKLTETETKLSELKTKLERNQRLTTELNSSFETMKKQKQSYESLEKEVIALTAQKDSLEKGLVPVDEKAFENARGRLYKLLDDRNKSSEHLKAVDLRNAELSKRSGSVAAELKSARESKIRLEKLRSELSSLLGNSTSETLETRSKELEKSLLSYQAERQSLRQQIADISDVLAKLRPGMAECPLCSSSLDEQSLSHIQQERKSLISTKEKRITEISSLLEKSKNEKQELVQKLQKVSTISNSITEAKIADIPALESSAETIKEELSALEKEKKTVQGSIDALGKELEELRLELRKTEEMLAKMKQLEDVRKKLSDAENKLSSMKFDVKEFESLREKAEAARLEAERLKSANTTLETEKKAASDILQMLRKELKELRDTDKWIRQLHSLEEELAIYRNALLETQLSLRGSLTDAINGAMNEIWPIFYPYHNYRALRLNVSEKDYLFEVNDGEWKSLDTIASGGERASAALTLRVALAMVLTPKLSWLILDEPTHNLDSQAVELLSSALQFKVPEVVRQTFVITHDEAFMGSDFASSYRLTRDKEKNGSTKAESI
jgi:exonuclease SbcC